jgi:hypothetical protein
MTHRFVLLSMSIVLAAASVASAAPMGCKSPKASIAVFDTEAGGISAEVTAELPDVIARAVASTGAWSVLSRADVRRLLSQSQLEAMVGAADESLGAVGSAVGACYVVASTARLVEGQRVFSLAIIDTTNSRTVKRVGRPLVEGETFLGVVADAAKTLMAPLLKSLGGFVEIRTSEEGADVVIDEQVVGQTPAGVLTIAGGAHEIIVRKRGFIEARRTVSIGPGETVPVEMPLIPSRDFAREHQRVNGTKRRLAWIGTAVAVAAGATAGYFLWNASNDFSDISRKIDAANAAGILADSPEAMALEKERLDVQNSVVRQRWVAGAGGALFVGGLSLALYQFLTGDDPSRYEAYVGQP